MTALGLFSFRLSGPWMSEKGKGQGEGERLKSRQGLTGCPAKDDKGKGPSG